MLTKEEILLKIKNYDYISFDIFDTLLKRNVEKPSDIFKYVERFCIKRYGVAYENFSEKRINAEKKARENREEVTINDIYKQLQTLYPKDELVVILREELNLEYNFCTANTPIKMVYDYCQKNNKKVEIVSDIYMPKVQIEKMLRKNGINNWDNLFISSEFNKTKATGALFDVVIEKLGISPNEIIHIGDNKVSDCKNAKKKGLATLPIKTSCNNLKYYNRPVINLDDKSARALVNNNILNVPVEKRLGFENMGTLLYGFCIWLSKQLRKNNIKNVFFLSRDGWIMKKAFDLVKDSSVSSHYFFASRRALQVPILAFDQITYDDFINRLHWPAKVDLRYFIKSLGIENNCIIKKIEKKYGVYDRYFVKSSELSHDALLRKIFSEPIFRENAKNEYLNLKGYLNQEHLHGKVAIVDIGWHGNMQKNLVDILNLSRIENDIYGYYVGVSPDENHKEKIKMEGYMFDENKNLNMFNIHHSIVTPFEQIFMAPHGSVKKYKLSKERNYCPVLYKYEQDDKNSIELLNNYQQGALKFINIMRNNSYRLEVSSCFACSGILLQFTKPYYSDAIAWGRIRFKDKKVSRLVEKENIIYLLHPVKFFRDYKESYWKAGFLKETLKLNIDYYKLMKFFSKLIKKSTVLSKINDKTLNKN